MATLRELFEKVEHLVESIYNLDPEGAGDGFILQRGCVADEAKEIQKAIDEVADLDEWESWHAQLTFELGLPVNTSRKELLELLRRRGHKMSQIVSDGIRELWSSRVSSGARR